jgi:hypothetical protein
MTTLYCCTFKQGRTIVVPQLLWQRSSVFWSHSNYRPIRSPLTILKEMWRIYSNPDLHVSITVMSRCQWLYFPLTEMKSESRSTIRQQKCYQLIGGYSNSLTRRCLGNTMNILKFQTRVLSFCNFQQIHFGLI